MQNMQVSYILYLSYCIHEYMLIYSFVSRSERETLRTAGKVSYKSIQTDFLGNTTTIRKHVSRKFATHFKQYWEGCIKKGVAVHTQYLSEDDLACFKAMQSSHASINDIIMLQQDLAWSNVRWCTNQYDIDFMLILSIVNCEHESEQMECLVDKSVSL